MMSLNNDYDNIETNYNNFYFLKKYSMSAFWNSPAYSIAKRSSSFFSFYLDTIEKKTFVGPGPGNYNSAVNISKKTPSWKYFTF